MDPDEIKGDSHDRRGAVGQRNQFRINISLDWPVNGGGLW